MIAARVLCLLTALSMYVAVSPTATATSASAATKHATAARVRIAEVTLPRGEGEAALPVRIAAPETGRRLPIVVFSHGAYSSKDDYAPIIDHWAAQGYVVFAVTHRDSTRLGAVRGKSDPRFMLWRVEDMRLLIDRLDEAIAVIPGLARRVDRSRLAIAGHSFGGLIAQTVGGGTLRDLSSGQPISHRHPAVRAVIIFSGAGPMPPVLQREDFASLTLPTLVTVGTKDLDQAPGLTGYEWRRQPYDLIAPGNKYLLVLDGADHYLGGIVGRDDLPRSPDAPTYLAAFNAASTLFLDAWLKNDRAARRQLRQWPKAAKPFADKATLEQR